MITIFIAKRENGEKIHLLYNCNEELLRRTRQQERFFCVACGKEVQMKLGKQKVGILLIKKWIHVLPFMKRNQSIICMVKNCYIDGSNVKTFRWI